MDFPHLTDATGFPGDNVAPYAQYRNSFDYNVWTPNTIIKLCRVKWRDDYHDVVKFKDDNARDEWFDRLDGETVRLTTNMYIVRADVDGIKIPIPYMTAQQYNYIVVDYSRDIMGTAWQKTDAQTRYHYFIDNVTAAAPNTTTCTLTRDVWTDYANTTTINVMLERGHAPLAATTPEQLLENPRDHCADFTLPDVDYGRNAGRVASSRPVSLQAGARWVCLATTFSPGQLAGMAGAHGTDISDTAPAYGDNDVISGGFNWGAGGVDTSGVQGSGTSYTTVDNRTPSNIFMYALRGADCSGTYFDMLFSHWPHIMSQIVACFTLTDSMMNLGGVAAIVNGVEWRNAAGRTMTLENIQLSPERFNYPREYQRVTRLYLAPYAHLEVSDNTGASRRVEIADCGPLSVRSLTSLSWPILRRVSWLDGVGASGDTTVAMRALNDDDITAGVPDADMLRTLITHDIPTYALQRRAIDAHRADNYNTSVQQARQNAIISYSNGARGSNTAQYNANDSAKTTQSNANASAATARSNTNRSNSAVTANTARGNQRDTEITTEFKSVRSDNLTYATTRLNADRDSANTKVWQDYGNDATLMNKAFIEGAQTNAITSVTSVVGTMAGAALTVATGGAGAVIGAGAAIGGAALQGFNTGMAITNSTELNRTANNVAQFKAKDAQTLNSAQTAHAVTQSTDTTNRANTQSDRNLQYSTNAATDITANTVNASNANATASYNTATGNAAASYRTATGNAKRSRDVGVFNGKQSLENARSAVTAAWRDLSNRAAAPVGTYAGDNFNDATGLDTMTIKIVTEDTGAISAAGEQMLRYGIAANRFYSMPNMTPCKHYTYWQCSDAWLTNGRVQNAHLDIMRDMLINGVTVWQNADEVGGDYIYNNL